MTTKTDTKRVLGKIQGGNAVVKLSEQYTTNIESISPEIEALEKIVAWCGSKLYEANSKLYNGKDGKESIKSMGNRKVTVNVVTAGKGKDSKNCLSSHRENGWTTNDGLQLIDSIDIQGSALNKPFEELVEMIMHQRIHLMGHELDNGAGKLKLISKGGSHNQKFQSLAESVGLECWKSDENVSYGFGNTKLGGELLESIAMEPLFTKEFRETFNKHLMPLKSDDDKPRERPPVYTFICECIDEDSLKPKFTIKTTAKNLNASCDECDKAFEIKPKN